MSGGILSGGILSGGYCPGGYCPGGYCPGGYCPRTEYAEFSAGLQTRQEERYVISLFLLILGGIFRDICAGHSPSHCEKRPCALIWACALNRKNMVYHVTSQYIPIRSHLIIPR